jgi:hypothetical protein
VLPWRETANLPLPRAAEIAGVSPAALYGYEKQGRLTFRRLAGRTLVSTESLIALVDKAEPWTPSTRGKEARAKRSERAAASWQE